MSLADRVLVAQPAAVCREADSGAGAWTAFSRVSRRFAPPETRRRMSTHLRSRLLALLLAASACSALAPAARAADVQANRPQVAGEGVVPGRDAHRFPDQQAERADDRDQPAGPPIRRRLRLSPRRREQRRAGAAALRPRTAPRGRPRERLLVLPGRRDGRRVHLERRRRHVDQPRPDRRPAAWKAAKCISDGDPVIVSGPKPRDGLLDATGARVYYASLASEKTSPFNGGKGGAEVIVASSPTTTA